LLVAKSNHYLRQFFMNDITYFDRFIRLLVDGWSLSECSRVEDGSLLPFVMLVEET
jgi:hypothetical protein